MSHKLLNILGIILITTCLPVSGNQAAAQLNPLPKGQPIQTGLPLADSTLDVCLLEEPESLYFYQQYPNLWSEQILSAVFDGPMDSTTYAYQPVIFEQVPGFDNGMVITGTVIVNEGDQVLDSSGSVVQLQAGMQILPAGCYSADCAITYDGGDVVMEQLVVTQTLLSDLTWSDGHPLTSGDMLYSFNLNADPNTPASKYTIERTASFITDTLTQTVWSGLPGYFPYDYPGIYWTPLPEHVWGAYPAAELISATVSARTPLGWGAYVIDEWVAGSHIALHKNPLYYRAGEGLPNFDNLVFHFGLDLQGILDGTCDIVPTTFENQGELLRYDDWGMLEVITSPGTVWEHLDFGIQSADGYDGFAGLTGAFQDVRVRMAFAYCIDRQTIVDTVYYGEGEPLDAFISADHPFFPKDAVIYPYDPALGGALLNEAGWVDSDNDGTRDKNGVEFSLTLKTSATALRMIAGNMIAEQMAPCGVQVLPEYIPASELFKDWPDGPLFGRKFDLGMFAWLSGAQPPCDLYVSWNIPTNNYPGGQNNTGYNNPLYDADCQLAMGSFRYSDRLQNFRSVTRLFTEELPVLPLFLRVIVGMTAPHINGFDLDPTENSLWNIEEIRQGVLGEIPPEGGFLWSLQDTTAYDFPTGVFTETAQVTHVPVSPVGLSGFGALEGGGHFFKLEATVNGIPVQPSLPFTMTISYTQDELDFVLEDTLGLYYWQGDGWVLEPTAVIDMTKNAITATPDHFSTWAVLGVPSELRFLPLVKK